MKKFEGKLVSKGAKIGIVAARFNEFITAKLLSGRLASSRSKRGRCRCGMGPRSI